MPRLKANAMRGEASSKKVTKHSDKRSSGVQYGLVSFQSVRSNAELKEGDTVPRLEEFLDKPPPKKPAKKKTPSKPPVPRKKTEPTAKKPKVDPSTVCHQCGKDPKKMTACESNLCQNKYCGQCLLEKYELKGVGSSHFQKKKAMIRKMKKKMRKRNPNPRKRDLRRDCSDGDVPNAWTSVSVPNVEEKRNFQQ